MAPRRKTARSRSQRISALFLLVYAAQLMACAFTRIVPVREGRVREFEITLHRGYGGWSDFVPLMVKPYLPGGPAYVIKRRASDPNEVVLEFWDSLVEAEQTYFEDR